MNRWASRIGDCLLFMRLGTSQADITMHCPQQMLRQLFSSSTLPQMSLAHLWCSPTNGTLVCSFKAVLSCVECWSDNVVLSQREVGNGSQECTNRNSISCATRACPAHLLVGDTMVTMLLLRLRWRKLVDSLVEMARVFLDWTLSVKSMTRYFCTCIRLRPDQALSFLEHVLPCDMRLSTYQSVMQQAYQSCLLCSALTCCILMISLNFFKLPTTFALTTSSCQSCSHAIQPSYSGLTVWFVLQRTQICYGSIGEVRRFEEFMLGKSERFADAAVKA